MFGIHLQHLVQEMQLLLLQQQQLITIYMRFTSCPSDATSYVSGGSGEGTK